MELDEFVNHKPNRCWMCALDPTLLAEVEAGWRKGIRASVITRYLRSKGLGATANKVEYHMKNHMEVTP